MLWDSRSMSNLDLSLKWHDARLLSRFLMYEKTRKEGGNQFEKKKKKKKKKKWTGLSSGRGECRN